MKNKIYFLNSSRLPLLLAGTIFVMAFLLRWFLFDLTCEYESFVVNHNEFIAETVCHIFDGLGYNYPDVLKYITGLKISALFLRFIFILLGSSSVLLICYITTRITNLFIGLIVALFASINFSHIFISSNVFPEAALSFFISLAVLLSLFFQKKYRSFYGGMLGLCIYTCLLIKQYVFLYLFSYPILYSFFYMRNSIKNCAKLFIVPIITVFVIFFISYPLNKTDNSLHVNINMLLTLDKGIVDNIASDQFSAKYQTESSLIDDKDSVKKENILVSGILNSSDRQYSVFRNINLISFLLFFILFVFGLMTTLKVKLFMPVHGLLIMFLLSSVLYGYDVFFRISLEPVFVIYSSVGMYSVIKKVLSRFLGITLSLSEDWRYNRLTI